MSVTISAIKRCSVRLYLQLFMSYLLHVCLLAYRDVQHLLFYFLHLFYVVSFSRLSIFDCPFHILYKRLFHNFIVCDIYGVAIMIVKHGNDRRRQRLNFYYKYISFISKTCLLFASTCVQHRYLLGVHVAHISCVVFDLIISCSNNR
jgi:hypothetical protein